MCHSVLSSTSFSRAGSRTAEAQAFTWIRTRIQPQQKQFPTLRQGMPIAAASAMDLDETSAIGLSRRLQGLASGLPEAPLSYERTPSALLVAHPVEATDDGAGVSCSLAVDDVIAANRIFAPVTLSKVEARSCRTRAVHRRMLPLGAEGHVHVDMVVQIITSFPHCLRSSAPGGGHKETGRRISLVKVKGANYKRCPERNSSVLQVRRSGFSRVRRQRLQKRRSGELSFLLMTLDAVKAETNGEASDVPTPRVSGKIAWSTGIHAHSNGHPAAAEAVPNIAARNAHSLAAASAMDVDETSAIGLSHRLQGLASSFPEAPLSYKTLSPALLVALPVGATDDRSGVSCSLVVDDVIGADRIVARVTWPKVEARSCRNRAVHRWMLLPGAECRVHVEMVVQRITSFPTV
ncbi:hypothetical protein HPB50_016430 [Hyalomma asiaticum]|uniref:Uncharacterized protein n=1 Tax=Hyalomma asiaticum TaxID=266040 RepID=A0ACB7TL88_HYAAI|nr:hypothetical protein HPB50_016430 [Hyalomma asiaticum]